MINSGMIGSQIANICHILSTGQETSYHTGDDGDLEFGIDHDYKILTAGQYSGTTNITINGKTHALSNNCVRDDAVRQNGQSLMWARYVPVADIGPIADGRLFWDQWTLGPKIDISFDAASKEIRSAAAEFSTGALCVGRKFTITGSANNNNTFTVVSITTSVCVVSETVVNEAAGASVSLATVGDLIWDFLDQANANALGGYTDWRIPNLFELNGLLNIGVSNPCIDTTAFPSTPGSFFWESTTRIDKEYQGYALTFFSATAVSSDKDSLKYFCRLTRS